MEVTPSPSRNLSGKFLCVNLDHESFGIPILKVREIIGMQKITPMPQLPDCVKGVINLRGRIVPIVDLRMKFGLPTETTSQTCIVVVEIANSGGRAIPLGVVVDAVDEVLNIPGEQIEPAPEIGARLDTSCIIGVAKAANGIKTLLDIDRVIAVDALAPIRPTDAAHEVDPAGAKTACPPTDEPAVSAAPGAALF